MRKLLLTSRGFTNRKIGQYFIELLDKPVFDAKILFIPTASRTKDELHYVEESKTELIQIGIKAENLFIYNLDKKLSYPKVNDFDVIYVCGGNTFYLTAKMREDGFNKVIKKLVKDGKLYLGVSAGSVLAGPNIDIASPFDPNDIGLKDWRGLNLTNTIVSPHYTNKDKDIIEKFKLEEKFKVVPLTDNQALRIIGNKEEIIE